MSRLAVHGFLTVSGIALVSLIYRTSLGFLSLYAGIALVLLALLWAVSNLNLTLAKVIYGLLLLPVITLACFHADNFYSYGPILKETVEAIFQTSNAEAVSYMGQFTSDWLVPVTSLLAIVVVASLWWIRSTPAQNYFALTALTLTGGALIYIGSALPLMIYETGQDYARKLKQFSEQREATLESVAPVQSTFKGNVIVFMGESISRHHLQIYGYPRKTTPFLDSIRDKLVVYDDIISTHSHTNRSLRQALTFNIRGSDRSFYELPDIISVANESSLDTWWLSNQNAIGVWDNTAAAIANQASQLKYHDPGSGSTTTRSVYDEALVESLHAALERPNENGKLIFLHPMATHFPYCEVVPPNFEPAELDYANPPMDIRFHGSWLIHLRDNNSQDQFEQWLGHLNCYDRAVSYIDAVLEKIVRLLESRGEPTALLMTADHGEAPILGTGHDSRKHSHFHVEVPFILWTNEAFKNLRPDLNMDPGVPATLADLSYSIADLAGISGPKNIGKRSIFSPLYDQEPRRTLNGDIGYDMYDADADHVERARANLFALEPADRQRVWAHRINSGAKMMVARDIFQGLELDLVFDDTAERFSVHHPPAPDTGLTLDLQLAQDRKERNYWLDWKNASHENITKALSRLKQLDSQFDIKKRSLIEISALDGTAVRLTQSGWTTSYYLPTRWLQKCLKSCTEKEASQLANELWDNFEANKFDAISLDARFLSFIENHMLKKVRRDNIPVYTWATGIDISTEDATEQLKPLLDRDWITVVLVTMPSYFGL